MMKKLLLVYVAVAITILLGINAYKIYDEKINKLSDEEMMNAYVERVLGNECHGVLLPEDGDKYVDFMIYDDAKDIVVMNHWCFERDYFEDYME